MAIPNKQWSFRNEQKWCGGNVVAVWWKGYWVDKPSYVDGVGYINRDNEGRAQKVLDDHIASMPERFKQQFKPEPGIIYNSALAGWQNVAFGPALLAAGFKLVLQSVNPNTGRDIFLYVYEPEE